MNAGNPARERVLLLMFPAVMVGLIYIGFYNRQGEVSAAEEARNKAVEMRPQLQAAALEQQSLVDKLGKEKADLTKENTDLDARWVQLRGNERSPAARTQAFNRVTRMLWGPGRNLHHVEEGLLEGNGKLPASFEEVLKKLNAPNQTVQQPRQTASTSRVWRVKFYGRYRDVLDVLDELANQPETDCPAIPVGISMSETKLETDWREWTLLLWL